MHPTIRSFGSKDGCLTIGGKRIDRLAARAGSTPYFAYDRDHLSGRIDLIRRALPAGIHLSYAVKANPMPAVVQHLSKLVDGFDVASALEMNIVLDTVMPASHTSFAGPGKTDAELARAIAAGVMIELESSNEARRVARIGDRMGERPRVALRVNPDFQIKGSGMRMGGGPQQFGMDAELVPEALKAFEAADLDFHGFHIFAGSQNLHAEILCEAQGKIAELFLKLADGLSQPVRYLNMGGGFGIPYFDKDEPLDLARVGDNLDHLVKTRLGPNFPEARVAIELGRYIVGECGIYVARVVDKKVSRGRTYLVVDGGLHHQLAASGNFGQVIRRNYPVAIGNRMDDEDREIVSIVGCLCTPLDLLADQVELPRADVGDLVVLFQAGAYGLTASPTAFLGHPAPPEMLV